MDYVLKMIMVSGSTVREQFKMGIQEGQKIHLG